MKYFLGIIGVVIIIVGAYFVFGKNTKEESYQRENMPIVGAPSTEPQTNNQIQTQPVQNIPKQETGTTTTTTATAKAITMADVSAHNTSTSCYSAVNGIVYDLTNWISRHPGGQREILAICGKDGSSAFNGQHGGDTKPERILAGFEIGTLAK